MKRQGSNELPRFAVGALAIAGASAANAATVQITFTGSYISTTGGNHIVTDFGADGRPDIFASASGATNARVVSASNFGLKAAAYSVVIGGEGKNVRRIGTFQTGTFGSNGSSRRLAAIVFSDSNIGALFTNGWLDITAMTNRPGEKRLTVHRLIFDDASATEPTGLTSASTGIPAWGAVPEPSSLGLLALGAGGLLSRRRRAA